MKAACFLKRNCRWRSHLTIRPRCGFPPTCPIRPRCERMRRGATNHITLMDGQIAGKLKELEEAGLAQDTIVFYYGDNGGLLPRSKQFSSGSGTHVPLIVYYPPKRRGLSAPPGSRISDPVCFVDFADGAFTGGREDSGVHARPCVAGRPRPVAGADFVFCTRDRMDELYDMMRLGDGPPLAVYSQLPARHPLRRGDGIHVPGEGLPVVGPDGGRRPTYTGHCAVLGREAGGRTLRHGRRPRQRPQPGRQSGASFNSWTGCERALLRHTLEINDNGFLPEAIHARRLRRLAESRPIPWSASSRWPRWPPIVKRGICPG